MKMSCQLHAPTTLTLGIEPLVPIGRRLGGLQCQSGCVGEEPKSLPVPGIKVWSSSL